MNNPPPETDARKVAKVLRPLLGYTQDGSQIRLTLSQDEDTGDYFVSVGDRTFSDKSFTGAIQQALDDYWED